MAARSLIGLMLAGILCCHSIEPARAGPYPDRPVRVVVPFRLAAPRMWWHELSEPS